MDIPRREAQLSDYLDRQPYHVEQDGISLNIAKNVFPSDFGLTSSFFGNFMLRQAPAQTALDMGCGSGYFAFLLKKIGCEQVLGADLNADAIACAQGNLALNPALAPISFVRSDLFASLPNQRFGLIVFNFNYYPSNGTFGLNEDGGRGILQRFFHEAPDYLSEDARIYIPFSRFVGSEHDPAVVGPELGFSCAVEETLVNDDGEHLIYRVSMRR